MIPNCPWPSLRLHRRQHSASVARSRHGQPATQVVLVGKKLGRGGGRCAPGAAKAGLASLMRPLEAAPGMPFVGCRYAVARAMPRRSLRRDWPGGVMSSPSSVRRAGCATRESRSACSGESLCPDFIRRSPEPGSYRFAGTNTQPTSRASLYGATLSTVSGCSVHDRWMRRGDA